MEGVSTKVYKGLRNYWRRRGYQRLTTTSRRCKAPPADGSTNRKRRWRVKITPRLKLSFFNPKKLFTGIRDGYVKMMLRIANSRAIGVSGYGTGFGSERCFVSRPMKEYDEKMLVELYKSILMSQGQLVPREAGRVGSKVECSSCPTVTV